MSYFILLNANFIGNLCLKQAPQSGSHPVTVMYPKRWLPSVSICISVEMTSIHLTTTYLNRMKYALKLLITTYAA